MYLCVFKSRADVSGLYLCPAHKQGKNACSVYQSSSNRGLWDPLMRASAICTTHSTGEWTETEDGVFPCAFYYAFTHSFFFISLAQCAENVFAQ